MHAKLVEDWLTKARERGGFDQAFAQLLTSQGHEVLWQGHSRIEFGKDIITIDPEGSIHAYQIKDEDLTLAEIRKQDSQITELVEVPIQHPRVPAGTSHIPHLITSGLAKEEVNLKILAKNQAWDARGYKSLEVVDRASLVPRFVQMADSFWPDRPKNIRDFFSFYLAAGRGDFDPQRFATLLVELLPDESASKSRAERVPSALAIIGNYMLSSFEREKDNWSLFRGWTIIASHIAWYAQARQLPDKHWTRAFTLAKSSAVERLKAIAVEAIGDGGLSPSGFEMDDFTRSRNTIVAGAISTWCLITGSITLGAVDLKPLFKLLVDNDRIFVWGESALPMVMSTLWATERFCPEHRAIEIIKSYVTEACERNTVHSDDEPSEPPQTDPDAILERLFSSQHRGNRPSKTKHLWALKSLIQVLARRGERQFLADWWPLLSKVDLTDFRPDDVEDLLLWHKVMGREQHRKLQKTQSWSLLCEDANKSTHMQIPTICSRDPHFAQLYFLAYPHRICTASVSFLDAQYRKEEPIQ